MRGTERVFLHMKPEHNEEEFEAEADINPEEEELELETWDSAEDEENGLTLDEEIGGYNEGLESKLDKFSAEY